jgi:hypothetical protein
MTANKQREATLLSNDMDVLLCYKAERVTPGYEYLVSDALNSRRATPEMTI